jgi:hypothetical protein
MDDMSGNLAIELNKFEFRIKEDPSVAQVVSRSGGGGGAISLLALLFLLAGPLLAYVIGVKICLSTLRKRLS